MAESMIERGAKKLLLLSRSSETIPAIESFVKRAQSLQGIEVVAIQGDVANMADVERAVAQATSMGPLKGVVHTPMVLKVRAKLHPSN